MRNVVYRIVNVLVFITSFFYFCRVVKDFCYEFCGMRWFRTAFVCEGVLFTLIVLLIKATRFYFIILEKRPGLFEFARLHIKTTLVSMLLPFKSGEFFRMYCFGEKLRSVRTGCLLVLVDRYFDTVPLLLLLIGAGVIRDAQVSGVVWLLSLFVILATVAYFSFPFTSRYLNRFLIVNTSSERGILALEWLKRMKDWHFYVRELIEGREAVLILFSGCAWGAEYAALWCLSVGVGSRFSPGDFVSYMNSIFSGGDSIPGRLYIGFSVLLLVAVAIVVYRTKHSGKEKLSA